MSARCPLSAMSDHSVLEQVIPEQLASTVEPRFHGFLWKQEDVTHVLVAKVHEVQQYCHSPKLRVYPHQRILDPPAHLFALDSLFRSRSLVCLLATHPPE